MANRFLSNIRINDAYTFPASDGNDGQVITTDGAGNLAFENVSPDAASIIYRDNFTGDGSTVTFDLQNSITDEDQTQIYIDGVYQEKSTYSISGTTITFTTAPILGHSVEVISISSINTGPTVLYQDNFTGNGNDTAFTLGQIIDNEIKTFIFLNGVYQFKNTYTVDGTTLTFDTAPANGVAIEVVSIASAVQSDSLEAGSVIIPVKNTHTASISKGTPVYITGNVGASERLQIAPADASNSAKMPAAGLLLTTLAVNAEGYVITGGYLRNLTTDTIDGTSTSSNDTVYVKPGGGLTMTKPTGSNLIQNVAKVARSASGNSGSLLVSSILRTNDVPNEINRDINFSDNSKLTFGNITSPDLQIYHDGLNSYIREGGTGDLLLRGNNLKLQTYGGADYLTASNGTQVELYYNNSKKLETTSTGVSVTGDGDALSINRGSFNVVTSLTSVNHNIISTGKAFNIKTSDSNGLFFSTNNTLAVTIDTSQNVGIGTTSPSSKLHIKQSVDTIDGGLTWESVNGTHEWSIDANNAGNFRIYKGTTAIARFDSSGNFGIGTSSPSTILHTSGSSATIYNAASVGGQDTSATLRIQNEITSANTFASIDFNTNNNRVVNRIVSSHGSSTSNGFLAFVTEGSGTPAERMRIESDGTVQITNSTSPKLQLKRGSKEYTTRIDNVNKFVIQEEGGNEFFIVESGASSNSIRIDSSGNVGIGTTSPTNMLSIKGTSGSSKGLDIYHSNGNKVAELIHGGSGDEGQLKLYDSNSETVRISGENNIASFINSGNVGIGTTSPTSKLDIAWGGYQTSGYALTFGADIGNLSTRTNNTTKYGIITGVPYTTTNPNIELFTYYSNNTSNALGIGGQGNTDLDGVNSIAFLTAPNQTSPGQIRMTIDSSGNVGIGTTSPLSLLNVNNSADGTDYISYRIGNTAVNANNKGGFAIYELNTLKGTIEFFRDGTGRYQMSSQGAGNPITFATVPSGGSLTERMRITSSGHVLIGKQSLSATTVGLEVESGGITRITKDGDTALLLNRLTNDGILLDFRKNTVQVGTISTNGNSLPSDRDFKKDITDLELGLDFVNTLNTKKYRYKISDDNSPLLYGIIAQDLEQSLLDFGVNQNEAVLLQSKEKESEQDSAYSLDYLKLIPVLINAIQELKAEIETLKTQING